MVCCNLLSSSLKVAVVIGGQCVCVRERERERKRGKEGGGGGGGS